MNEQTQIIRIYFILAIIDNSARMTVLDYSDAITETFLFALRLCRLVFVSVCQCLTLGSPNRTLSYVHILQPFDDYCRLVTRKHFFSIVLKS